MSWDNEDSGYTQKSKSPIAIIGGIAAAILIIVVAILGYLCYPKVDPGNAGIIYTMNGGIDRSEILGQGHHWVWITSTLIEYPTSTETVSYLAADKNSIMASTKDSKQVAMDLQYTYHMEADRLPDIYTNMKGKTAQQIEATYMKQKMNKAVNEITSNYSLMEIAGDKLTKINTEIFNELKTSLAPEGIILEDFTISNVSPDKQTQDAIQNVINAQNALSQSNLEKQKADIEAQKARIEAQGKVDAAVIAAEGQARANDKIQESLSDLIIQQRMIDKWDGKLPQVSGGGGNMFNLGDILTGAKK